MNKILSLIAKIKMVWVVVLLVGFSIFQFQDSYRYKRHTQLQMDSLKSRIEGVVRYNIYDASSNAVEELSSRVDDLENTGDDNETKISDLETKVSDLDDDVSNLKRNK